MITLISAKCFITLQGKSENHEENLTFRFCYRIDIQFNGNQCLGRLIGALDPR
jgi:hypothetical protein